MKREAYVTPELKVENLDPEEALLCTYGSGTDVDDDFCWGCWHTHARMTLCKCGHFRWWW